MSHFYVPPLLVQRKVPSVHWIWAEEDPTHVSVFAAKKCFFRSVILHQRGNYIKIGGGK